MKIKPVLRNKLPAAGRLVAVVAVITGMSAPVIAQVVLQARPAAAVRNLSIRGAAKPEDNSHAERCLAAIDLAMLAAESGIMDVSVEAMRRATMKGPPVANMQLGGLLGSKPAQQQGITVNFGSAQATPATSAQAKLAARLLELHEIWKKKAADPTAAYEAFKSLVFPPERPSEAFAYASRSLERKQVSYSRTQYDVEAPQVEPCAAIALVEWARTAGKEEDLLTEAKNRDQMPGAMVAALLVEVLLAQQESRPIDDARALCDTLATRAKLLVSGPDSVLLFGHAWKLLERLPADAPERKRMLDAIGETLGKDQNWAANEWLVFLVARGLRDALDAGDEEQFHKYARVSNSRFDSQRSGNADYVASQEAAMYGWATRRAFAAGHLRLAADCLRLQHSLPVSQTYLRSQSDAILDPLQPVVQALLTLDRAERYDIFKGLVWKMPNLGMTRCSRLNSNEQVPQVFRAAGAEVPWRAISAANARSASLLEWTMRDAIALGKKHEIENEIKRLQESGSDDARIARAVFSLAQDQPIDVEALLQETKDGRQLQTLLGEGNQVLPLDLEIVEQALAQPAHREAGLKFLNRMLDAAIGQNQEVYVSLIRAIKLREREEPFDVTHAQLAHWIVADDIKEADYTLGNPAQTLWVNRDDKTWGHQVGTNFSTLMFRYPLTGEYTVSFRVHEGKYTVGAASIAGRMIEFLQHRNRLQVWGLGHRNMASLPTTELQAGAYNEIRLERKSGTLTVHVNDKFNKQLDVPDADFPFFGLASYHYRESSFNSVAIAGDVKIPRSAEMLTPGLLGWSARFKAETMPRLVILPESELTEEDERVDWRLVEGVLESVKREEPPQSASAAGSRKYERTRKESVMQYLRPLAPGEEISLEFFHEPGKYSLAPALGRIAILLDGEKIGLHWITADPAGVTTGVDDANRVEDTEAQQPESVALKAGDWNKLSLKLDGDDAVLSINDQVVYRRQWEPEAGRLFGLFHDPSQYEVRMRRARLTGPWPEVLPADLLEIKPAAEVTSVDVR